MAEMAFADTRTAQQKNQPTKKTKRTSLSMAKGKFLSIFNNAEEWRPEDPSFRPMHNKIYKVKRPIFVDSYPARLKDRENYQRNGKEAQKKRHLVRFRIVGNTGNNTVLVAGRKFRTNGTFSERVYCAELPLKKTA
jgi:hypothetical protein